MFHTQGFTWQICQTVWFRGEGGGSWQIWGQAEGGKINRVLILTKSPSPARRQVGTSRKEWVRGIPLKIQLSGEAGKAVHIL